MSNHDGGYMLNELLQELLRRTITQKLTVGKPPTNCSECLGCFWTLRRRPTISRTRVGRTGERFEKMYKVVLLPKAERAFARADKGLVQIQSRRLSHPLLNRCSNKNHIRCANRPPQRSLLRRIRGCCLFVVNRTEYYYSSTL